MRSRIAAAASAATIDREPPGAPDEAELIREAARAGTRDHWRVGRAVSAWFARYARGRGEAEFSEAVNSENPDAEFSPDYVRRCRNVFDAFPERVAGMSWSHHLRALEGSAGNRGAAREWVEKAAAGKWSVRDLLARMDEAKAAKAPPPGEDPGFEVISGDPSMASDVPFTPDDEAPGGAGGKGRGGADPERVEPSKGGSGRAEAALKADDGVEVVRIEPSKVNDPVSVIPARAAPDAVLPESAGPEEVSRWVCSVIEHPALLLHHQVMRKIDRFTALPPGQRQPIVEAIDRLSQTLAKLREALA
jgi:hypothetical protein